MVKYCSLIALIVLILFVPFAAKSQTLIEAVNKNDTILALKLIKSGSDPNKLDENGSSPLMIACRWSDIAMIKLLLANGAKPDEPRSAKGRTPLMIACAYYGGITTTTLLTKNGADVNAVSSNGTTALMLAAQNAKIDVVEHLIAKGADVSKKDATGMTALDYAIKAEIADYTIQSNKDARIDKSSTIAKLKSVSK